MSVRKLYTNENSHLEMQWSPEGIHITITRDDVEIPFEHIIQPSDFFDFSEDLEIYMDCVNESNNE